MSKVFLHANWLNLVMVNYEIDPSLLLKYIPAYTELEHFNGIHYVSLVGFLFDDTKIKGVPVPFHRRFEEINLRFYVRQKENNKWKRGVVFLREIVALPIIAAMANLLYGEHYRVHKTKHVWNLGEEEWRVEYYWKPDKEWNYLKVVTESGSHPIEEGSEEAFIAIQNWGFTRMGENKTSIYQVHHPNWRAHQVRNYQVLCNSEKMFGVELTETLSRPPRSVFFAEGSAISVMHKKVLHPSNI